MVYNGAVEPRKNMEGLIRAFARLPDRVRHRHQLVLVCRLAAPRAEPLRGAGPEPGPGRCRAAPHRAGIRCRPGPPVPQRHAGGVSRPSTRGTDCRWPRPWPAGRRCWRRATPPSGSWWTPRPPSTPTTSAAMAQAIERGLVDESYRDPTAPAWSARPRPTWTEVAERAAAVYRELSADAGSGPTGASRRRGGVVRAWPWSRPGRRPPPGWPRTPVAWPGPWPTSVDVELFIDGDAADEHPDRSASSLVPGPRPSPRSTRSGAATTP